jgi:Sulfotransferase family
MSMESRRDAWQPPVRPEWVERINAEGAGLDLQGVVPLDPASLIAVATANTGLADFGADDWRDPFERFCAALDAEAELNLMGRILSRTDLLMFLEARLRVEDLYSRHPEIDDVAIEAPIWILGQGRTGTSMLQVLMALPPENRTLTICEALFPVNSKAHFAEADHRIGLWNRVTPEVATIHDFAAHEPIETIMIESLSFQQPAWMNLLGLTPGFTQWIATDVGMKPALTYGKRVLKAIQWQNPGRRWVLKSPDALRYMPDVLAVYPDVRFVWAHRDPVVTLSSAVNMIGTLTWVRSDRKLSSGVFDAITDPDAAAQSMTQPISWIKDGTIPAGQLVHVMYRDLIDDPLAAVQGIYRDLGMEFSDGARAAIQAHLDAHPREARRPHRYSVGEEDRIARERQAFERYETWFKVPRDL